VTAPQHRHTSDTTANSVTFVFAVVELDDLPALPRELWRSDQTRPAHPHSAGGHSMVASGSSTSRLVTPGAPNGLPRLPPEDPEDRFNLAEPSCDGGWELLEESRPQTPLQLRKLAGQLRAPRLDRGAQSSRPEPRPAKQARHTTDAADRPRAPPEPCHTDRSSSIMTRRELKLNTYVRSLWQLQIVAVDNELPQTAKGHSETLIGAV
jgi:hypothetical protein